MSKLTDEQLALVCKWLRAAMENPNMDSILVAECAGALFSCLMEIRKKSKKGKILTKALAA